MLNDLIDLESDRAHPRKRLRPFAAGRLSPPQGLAAARAAAGSAALAARRRPAFQVSLASYFVLTLAYTFDPQAQGHHRLLDAGRALHAAHRRRLAGRRACRRRSGCSRSRCSSSSAWRSSSAIPSCRWASSSGRAEAARPGLPGQRPAAGADDGRCRRFRRRPCCWRSTSTATPCIAPLRDVPKLLWLLVPIQLYWISRMWMQAQRGHMHDDPVVFAVRDRSAWSAACCSR